MAEHVHELMTPVPLTVPVTCPLTQAARLMRRWDVRQSFVVNDDGTLAGILRDQDIIVVAIASGQRPSSLTAADCIDTDAPRLEADQPITEALSYMRSYRLRRVAVVDAGKLVGSVWINDLEAVADAQHGVLRSA